LEEKFQSLLFFTQKNFHKVSDGFLFVMPNPLRVTTLDWFGIFISPILLIRKARCSVSLKEQLTNICNNDEKNANILR